MLGALIYHVRYTEYRYPAWFHKTNIVQYPFLLLPENGQLGFRIFAFHGVPLLGLQNADRVLALNGTPVTGTAVFGEEMNKARPGDSLRVTVQPNDTSDPAAQKTVSVPLARAAPQNAISIAQILNLLLLVIMPWFCLLLGFGLAAIRPRDIRAWLLLALMLGFAGFFDPGVEFWGPWLRDYGAVYHALVSDCLPIWLLLFGIYFPEPFPAESQWSRWSWLKWIIIVPLAVEILADVIVSVGSVENYASVFFVQQSLNHFSGLVSSLLFTAVIVMFLCLAAKLRLAVSRDAKRRLRLLFAGVVLSLTPALALLVVAHLLSLEPEQYFPIWVNAGAWLLFFVFPLTLAYVIAVHRAMDVRVVIRQGLQYTLARGGIRILRLALVIILGIAVFSSIRHVGQNSLLTYVIIGLGVVIWFGLRRLVEALRAWTDRQFFRDAYNADQILSELGENVRSIVETRPLLDTVARRISQSLHVSHVAVLMDGSGPYQPAYALGYDSVPEVLFPQHAATVNQLREAKQPARVYFDDPNSWLYKTPGMTDEERAQLAALEPELLLPLSVRDKLIGFISLGGKRSEEPYSPTDLRLLQSVAAQTGLALQVARLTTEVAEQAAQREKLNREVEIAREVQERLFPQELPCVPGLDFYGQCRPALGVGGDYYDFLALSENRLGIALADVSGKGIAAALMMASLQASLRAEASRGTDDLAAVIQKVNRLLFDATAMNRYATFFYAQYDSSTRCLTYVNAGHNPPLLFRNASHGGEIKRLDIGGTVVGLLKDFPFQQASVTLEEGDLLVAFTDGITETMNAADEEWEEENLIRTIQGCRELCANQVIDRIMAAADAFASGAKQHDDMTLVVLRVAANSLVSADEPREP